MKNPNDLIKIPEEKKIRVIIDTDAACEADDPFAIAQALMSPKLIVKGILAEHFREPDSTQRSYDEVKPCSMLWKLMFRFLWDRVVLSKLTLLFLLPHNS